MNCAAFIMAVISTNNKFYFFCQTSYFQHFYQCWYSACPCLSLLDPPTFKVPQNLFPRLRADSTLTVKTSVPLGASTNLYIDIVHGDDVIVADRDHWQADRQSVSLIGDLSGRGRRYRSRE